MKENESLLKEVVSAPLMPVNNLGMVPTKGIYIFYEDNKPIYVGRTNRMRSRLQEHCRQSSTHNSAPFAFNIAKKIAQVEGVNITKKRTELEKDSKFKLYFAEAKIMVSKMSVRVIEINDPILQTLFEVYASMELDTKEFNSFDNH